MIDPNTKMADLTVAEFRSLVKSSLFGAAKLWLALTLGIPAAFVIAALGFYAVIRFTQGA